MRTKRNVPTLKAVTCLLEGCSKPITRPNIQGWCRMHRARWERHGDPLTRIDKSRPEGELVSYRAMHTRVANAKGSAKDWECLECGRPAFNWAYDHADPREVWGYASDGVTFCAYSLNVEHYQPMCRSCHNVFDNRLKREGRANA